MVCSWVRGVGVYIEDVGSATPDVFSIRLRYLNWPSPSEDRVGKSYCIFYGANEAPKRQYERLQIPAKKRLAVEAIRERELLKSVARNRACISGVR